MLQHNHQKRAILITGASGTGKTTWFLRYLVNTKAKLKVVYDHDGDLQHRLKIRPARSPIELLDQAATGFVLFDHSTMFHGRSAGRLAGLRFICEWAMAISEKMPGRKLFALDEIAKVVPHSKIPWELESLMDTGRRCGLDFVGTGKYPTAINPAVRAQCNYVVAFRQNDANAAGPLAEDGLSIEAVLALPKFHFIALDKETGQETRGTSPRG